MNPARVHKLTPEKQSSRGAKITIRNFQKKVTLNPAKLKQTILNVLSGEKRRFFGEIAVCFVTDKKIREFNLKYLEKDAATDVIAFKMRQGQNDYADIMVSVDTAVLNAAIFKTTARYELYLYVVHGLLHILGYDDATSTQRKIMREKEKLYAHP